MTSQYEKEVMFTCAVRGFHYYRKEWHPMPAEILSCKHERNNVFDRFAIKTMKTDSGRTVGHFPIEISRVTKFLLDRGAEVSVKLTETYYRRSPLVQGGLEIPYILMAKMNGYSVRNQMLLQKYQKLVSDLYAEPKNEEILGSFLVSCIEPEPKRTATGSRKKKKMPQQNTTTITQGADIRSLFRCIENENREINNTLQGEEEREEDIIVLD